MLLDGIFGRAQFLNEIIWAYDYGARTRAKWPAKHDNILLYAKDCDRYVFDVDAIDRIPYMAPGLVGPEKAARGKLPTDTWWHTIVSPTGKEKLGYPTQKPLGILSPDREGLVAAGRARPRLLRGQRDCGRRRPSLWPALYPRRRQPAGHRRHEAPLRPGEGRRLPRVGRSNARAAERSLAS